MFSPNQADMAQLVEQRIRNAWVTSSSLVIGSNFYGKPLCLERLFLYGSSINYHRQIELN